MDRWPLSTATRHYPAGGLSVDICGTVNPALRRTRWTLTECPFRGPSHISNCRVSEVLHILKKKKKRAMFVHRNIFAQGQLLTLSLSHIHTQTHNFQYVLPNQPLL